ncbi:MAG: dephospho-CoA kinase [Bacteroidetes bacterium]|nr:dephospho-CoA kinase [Bacteroidota bacterium]
MLRIGITGGIGSGKSVVCEYFKRLQVPVYNADDRSNVIIDNDPEIREQLIAYFGPQAYLPTGLNRAFIREIVFNNSQALSKLNSITHPVIFKNFDDWCHSKKKQKHEFIIKEAALVFESDSYKFLDFIVCVVAPVKTRIARVMHRDHKSIEEIEKILKKQLPDAEKIKRSDYVIHNPNDELLLPKIIELHKFISKKLSTYGQ